MHAYATLGMLALAGSALAAPSPHWGGHRNAPHIVYETAIVTVIVGPDGQPIGGGAAPTPTPEAQATPEPAPAEPTSVVVEAPQESYVAAPPPSTPVVEQPPPSSTQVEAPPAATPTEPASGGSTGTYMDTVNEWRSKLGLSQLEHDDKLESNALKTCNDGNGEMVHELNDGTMGQVLAPGQADEFEHVFVGGWLCERPDLPGLDGICSTMSEGWAYGGQTGHADILTSPSYSKIGCALAKGIWGCDLA